MEAPERIEWKDSQRNTRLNLMVDGNARVRLIRGVSIGHLSCRIAFTREGDCDREGVVNLGLKGQN